MEARYEEMLAGVVAEPVGSPDRWSEYLVQGEQYLVTNFFGGQTNQLFHKLYALYAARELGAVALLPSFVAIHFSGHTYRPVDTIYDMPRFYDLAGVRAFPLRRISVDVGEGIAGRELLRIPCWTFTAYAKPDATWLPPPAASLSEYGIHLDYSWPDPDAISTPAGQPVALDEVLTFLSNRTHQTSWIEQNRVRRLPDNPPHTLPIFDAANIPPVALDNPVQCVDALFYVRSDWSRMWDQIGQHLHFEAGVQQAAEEYLRILLDVPEGQDFPPYISVHVRGTDFRIVHGSIPSPTFVDKVAEVRQLLAKRSAAVESNATRAGTRRQSSKLAPEEEYPVVFTTDEQPTSAIWRELESRGWKGVDHTRFNTTQRFDPWYPSLIDAAILAGAQGMVGTALSTYSFVSGERVKSWQGGVYLEAKL
ncbi:hypothetical protein Rt10032_c13g5015 [Rhodotorula toruloides]|uniref:Uncharacterized protein n=1 Tax=Rhodotorula toruloides TaxID=5286 RepID=A0A511KKU8_RHOTO|nr:hypothetical protein Rt10032_c13g5015 [Rhodotorula toruloides]